MGRAVADAGDFGGMARARDIAAVAVAVADFADTVVDLTSDRTSRAAAAAAGDTVTSDIVAGGGGLDRRMRPGGTGVPVATSGPAATRRVCAGDGVDSAGVGDRTGGCVWARAGAGVGDRAVGRVVMDDRGGNVTGGQKKSAPHIDFVCPMRGSVAAFRNQLFNCAFPP